MYQNYNANPKANRGDDCTVRAISTVMEKEWEDVYLDLCLAGLLACDMPSANHVWGGYLKQNGFTREVVPNTCPDCYTVRAFVNDHPTGSYIIAVDGHVIAVINGVYYDTWDSGDEVPIYYWQKG